MTHPSLVLYPGCELSPAGPPCQLTGRRPPRLPAAGHLPAVGVHTPAGAAFLPALDGPEGRRHSQLPFLFLSIPPSFSSFKLGRDWCGAGQVTRERESADPRDSPAHSFSTRPVCQPCSKGHPGVHAPAPWRLQGVKVLLTWTRSGQTVAWVTVTQEALRGSPRGSDG